MKTGLLQGNLQKPWISQISYKSKSLIIGISHLLVETYCRSLFAITIKKFWNFSFLEFFIFGDFF